MSDVSIKVRAADGTITTTVEPPKPKKKADRDLGLTAEEVRRRIEAARGKP